MATKVSAIRNAFKQYAQAYQEYHRTCKQLEIIVKTPRIFYHAGAGYEIGGKIQRSTAESIIAALNANTEECIQQMRGECGDLSFDASNPVSNAEQRPSEAWYANIHPPLEPLAEEMVN